MSRRPSEKVLPSACFETVQVSVIHAESQVTYSRTRSGDGETARSVWHEQIAIMLLNAGNDVQRWWRLVFKYSLLSVCAIF